MRSAFARKDGFSCIRRIRGNDCKGVTMVNPLLQARRGRGGNRRAFNRVYTENTRHPEGGHYGTSSRGVVAG